MAIQIKNEVLTAIEIDKLKKTKWAFVGVVVFCSVFVSIALGMMSGMLKGIKLEFPDILFVLFPAFFVAIPGVMIWFVYRTWRGAKLDLALGTKEILIGCVTGKRISVSTGKNSTNRTTYFVSIEEEEELTVDASQYYAVEEGDVAEVYRGANSKVIFDIKNNTRKDVRKKAEDLYSKMMNPETAMETAKEIMEEQQSIEKSELKPLSKEDNEVIQKKKSKRMTTFVTTAMIIIGVGGVYYEYLDTYDVLSSFFMPLLILAIVMIYRNVFKGLMAYLSFTKVLSTGTKTVKHLKVLKREHYSKKGTLYYIQLQGDLRIKVKKDVYDYLKVNDVVEVGFIKETVPLYFKNDRVNPVYYS